MADDSITLMELDGASHRTAVADEIRGASPDPQDGARADERTPANAGFAEQVRSLSQVNGWRAAAAIAFDWGVIVAAFACALQFPQIWVWCLAAIVIAARQHAMLILMHDASHFRLCRNRTLNDRASNWLLAWPLLVSTEGYRANHFAHHSNLNTDDDPDWIRKVGRPEWTFPKTRWGLTWLLLKELCGGGFIEALRAIGRLSGRPQAKIETRMLRFERPIFYAAVAALVIATGLWPAVLILWFAPAFTLLPVLLRMRSIAEHFGVEGDHEFNKSRNTHCAAWERFLLAPHHCGFHLDHHLYPSVPFYNLPRLHSLLLTLDEYQKHSHQTRHFVLSRESIFNELTHAG